ncbi:SDR family oxidoreductase [Saccharopolyspora shandongensis]
MVERCGSLDEQAGAITFLASDEASYVTGTVLPVAGAISVGQEPTTRWT